MKKIILWDWDGTLVNSLPYKYEEIWNEVFKDNVDAQDIVRAYIQTEEGKRCNRYGLIAHTLQQVGELESGVDANTDPTVERYAGLYKRAAADAIPTFGLLPGANEVLKELSDTGHRMYLVSGGGSDKDLDVLLTQLNVRDFFEGVFGFGVSHAVGVGFGKYDNFLRITEKENTSDKEKFVVIGDTKKDKELAEKIGCDFIGITHKYNDWKASRSEKIVSTLPEILEILS